MTDLKALAEAAKVSSYVADTGEVFYQPHPLAEFRRACTVEGILALYAERDEARQEVADLRKDQGYIIGWNSGWDEAFSRLRFPTMLRKMWSGGEVQRWLDEHKAEQTSPPAGSLSERLAAAEASLASYKEEVERLRPVFAAAQGLCRGEDWNNGTQAKQYGYRRKLIEAVNAATLTQEPHHGR